MGWRAEIVRRNMCCINYLPRVLGSCWISSDKAFPVLCSLAKVDRITKHTVLHISHRRKFLYTVRTSGQPPLSQLPSLLNGFIKDRYHVTYLHYA